MNVHVCNWDDQNMVKVTLQWWLANSKGRNKEGSIEERGNGFPVHVLIFAS